MLKYQTMVNINYMGVITIVFCRYGSEHRSSRPSRVRLNSVYKWYEYGKPHRINGPSLIYGVGKGVYKEYWIRGYRHA